MSEFVESLDQLDIETWFLEHHGREHWTRIYQRGGDISKSGITLYSCLIPNSMRRTCLKSVNWCFRIGEGRPGFEQRWNDGTAVTRYRQSSGSGIEPLVVIQYFPHERPSSIHVSEDIRLLFNLVEDRQAGKFYYVDDGGDELEVLRVTLDRVEIRTSLLLRYLAARQKTLVLQIDSDVWSVAPTSQRRQALPHDRNVRSQTVCLDFYSGILDSGELFTRLLGQKAIAPPPIENSGIWPFEAPKQFLEFIIGETPNGEPVEHSCNPDLLANNFGANAGAPHYLMPVFFKRDVLLRYYEESHLFSIHDGSISRGGVWQIRVDNDHPDHVVVFLGDLGRDLPTTEQRYWRYFNMPPGDRSLSETAIRRSFLGQWWDSESPDYRFKYQHRATNQAWREFTGWQLFRDLHPSDHYVLDSFRLLLSSSAKEFDSQILALAKLVVDSLNEQQIVESLTSPLASGAQGIVKLEQLLTEWSYEHVARDITLLRTIQGVRSRGVAHLKSSNFDLARAGLDQANLEGSFRLLLEGVNIMLADLEEFIRTRQCSTTLADG